MTDRQTEIQRGARAAQLLADPMMQEAFREIERAMIEKWISSPVRDAEGQHELYLMVKSLRRLRSYFEDFVTTGRMAEIQLQQGRQ